ncbi:SRPBCC family protein [Mycobacterium sp. Lab-001]|uniref:SRPBCC family protein n=1 Tax=Mycobacterium sp. Lab-001 TaxID=3410136 RepID=UPI003D174219
MSDKHRSRRIVASPQEIWDVLADFGSVSSWAGNVGHSCILFSGPGGAAVGTARRVQFNREALIERIIEFDPPHVLGYDIEGLPGRLRRVANRWTLAPVAGGATVVSLTSTVEVGPRAPHKLAERIVCLVMARESGQMLAGLASRLEDARV